VLLRGVRSKEGVRLRGVLVEGAIVGLEKLAADCTSKHSLE
jgi:hypothetical protein